MWKEQHSGGDSYLKCTDWPSVRQQSKLPAYCSFATKIREREKLLNCVKGLDPTTREIVWGLYFFNSWLFLLILCSPLYLYLEPWSHSLDASKNWNRPTSTLSSLQAANRLLLQTRACISNWLFLLARTSVAGGGGCWSLQGWLCVWGVPKGLIYSINNWQIGSKISKSWFGSCCVLPCLATNPLDILFLNTKHCALQELHIEHRVNEGKGRQ